VALASIDSVEVPIAGPSRALSNRALSADGRLLVFTADAAIDGANPGNLEDVFVRDRIAGTTQLVSKATNGTAFTTSSDQGAISGNGRFVAFRSFQAGAGISGSRVFLRDRQAATTTSLPVPPGATVCEEPKVDDLGNVVAQCGSTSVGVAQQAWFWRAATGAWTQLSRTATQPQGNGPSGNLTDISADGTVVVFDSDAGNLDPGDSNTSTDVFVGIEEARLFGLFADGFE
jgi:Tol biopolymer transport system component